MKRGADILDYYSHTNISNHVTFINVKYKVLFRCQKSGSLKQTIFAMVKLFLYNCITTGQDARLEVNDMRMLRLMCGVTRRDKIRNEHTKRDNKSGAGVQENYRKRLKWYGGYVRRMKEEHIVRRMLYVDIPGKRRRGRPNLRWKMRVRKM